MGRLLVMFVLSCIGQIAHAGIFDTDKSKLEFSFGLENSASSAFKKTELSWDGIWHFENDQSPALKFSSKPYYKYSSSELQTSQERTSKIGFDAVKLSYAIGELTPYIAIGAEQQNVETTSSLSGTTTNKNTYSSLGYGLTYTFGEGSGASVTLYFSDKYTKLYAAKKTNESGIKLSFDLCKLLDRCKKE